MSNITDKVVVITGASSGIGESAAKFLAAKEQSRTRSTAKDRIDEPSKKSRSPAARPSGSLSTSPSAQKWNPSSKGPSRVSVAWTSW